MIRDESVKLRHLMMRILMVASSFLRICLRFMLTLKHLIAVHHEALRWSKLRVVLKQRSLINVRVLLENIIMPSLYISLHKKLKLWLNTILSTKIAELRHCISLGHLLAIWLIRNCSIALKWLLWCLRALWRYKPFMLIKLVNILDTWLCSHCEKAESKIKALLTDQASLQILDQLWFCIIVLLIILHMLWFSLLRKIITWNKPHEKFCDRLQLF